MRHSYLTSLLLVLGLCAAASAGADPAPNPSLDVEVSGIHHARGRIGCLLFRSDKGFPKDASHASQRAWVGIEPGKSAVCSFKSVPAGDYAVAVMHDENGNGELDSNLVGAPTEGYGFSNNAKSGMFGPPSFEKARLRLADSARWGVRLVYP